ncbi:hypothetical protein GUITHDRAFT_117382 [Guillardia theta CCMP2712]|uniref:Uncharacterized protein n=1 Tax=Guillardia theta (strain CCMP2712) TaxID=905079 RepID=L1IL16_GUITC|nr:hypothetical protein GUITHDRAFT_117382 [Guillardia theta CCMP2712]EKX36490.1 hypothetical protein GUITHDRAFT_117382 [Guillardia theta CCMP2712]|eukprot:XP_005823470.1 hypothetical protein GUITHDRAFT_117382 [Guillardia theta CCMP2712]
MQGRKGFGYGWNSMGDDASSSCKEEGDGVQCAHQTATSAVPKEEPADAGHETEARRAVARERSGIRHENFQLARINKVGQVRREGEEWKKQPVPILLLKQSFRLLVWSFFLSWMFELSKRLVMMGGDVLSWTSAASAQGGFPILVQKNLELMTANFASLSAIPPFMQGMVLTMQSWNLPLVYHPVMFLIATIKTALAACFIVLKGIFAFIVCSLQDAGGNLIFIGLQLQKVLFIIATWMLGIASQFFLSDSICLSIFRRDFVFYFITTLVLRRMALFYQNYEDWDATQSRMQLSQPFKGVPRTDSITGKGFWEVLSSSSWIFTAIGFILPFLPIALAAGTGGEWQLVASIFAPYFLGVGLELGTVDLLRDKLKSPAWVAVILPYSIWRILQLSFINTHLESALVLLAPSPLFLFSPPPALIAAAINTPALLSGVWLARLCVHISDIPSFFAWKRKPTAKDREMVLKWRQEVEELKDEVEGLKENG